MTRRGLLIRNSALEAQTSALDQLGQQRCKTGLVTLFDEGLLVGFVGVQNAAPVEWVQLNGASSALAGFCSKCLPGIELPGPHRYSLSFYIWVLFLELVLTCCPLALK